MSPNIQSARKHLAYPLYGADFDPLNHDFLLVGGGGGSSSTGVPNRINLIDASKRTELNEIVAIDLAKDEDSVVSLAVARSDNKSLLAYAGINGSAKAQKAGKNDHFRSFTVALPAKKKKTEAAAAGSTSARTQPLARSALFRSATNPNSECYQRVLRLSPARLKDTSTSTTGEKEEDLTKRELQPRMCATASGLGTPNEVLVFPVSDSPSSSVIISRINLEKNEAADVDIVDVNNQNLPFTLAYCTENELFLQQLPSRKVGDIPEPISVLRTDVKEIGRFRALRFLNSRYLILVQNRPNRGGVDLVVFKMDKDFSQGRHVLRKRVERLKQAVGLDTCTLSASPDGTQQFVVAVAGQDSSIHLFAIDWLPGDGIGKFQRYAVLEEVHKGPITKIAFSTFFSPALPISSRTLPQYIRLASVSVDLDVVVHTLPLSPTPAAGTGHGQETPRYVLIRPGELLSYIYNFVMAFMTLILVALTLVTFMELRGATPPVLGTSKYLPRSWQEKFGKEHIYVHGGGPGPVIPESMPAVESLIGKMKEVNVDAATDKAREMGQSIPSLDDVQDTLVDLVNQKKEDMEHVDKAVVIRAAEEGGAALSAELSHAAEVVKDETLKKWEHLTEKEKRSWKRRLIDAGHWTEKQGEAVLRGVLFSELAGIVARL